MENKTSFRHWKWVVVCVFVMITLVVFGIFIDYKNLFGNIVEHANFDFLTVYINAIIVVGMFIIAYLMIDDRNLKRTEVELNNKRQIMKKILLFTYDNCSNNLKVTCSDGFDKYYDIVTRGGEIEYDNTKYRNFQNLPFLNDTTLINLFCSGAMDADRFEKYITIKNMYYSCTDGLLNLAMTGVDMKKSKIKKMIMKYVDETQRIIGAEIKIIKNE